MNKKEMQKRYNELGYQLTTAKIIYTTDKKWEIVEIYDNIIELYEDGEATFTDDYIGKEVG